MFTIAQHISTGVVVCIVSGSCDLDGDDDEHKVSKRLNAERFLNFILCKWQATCICIPLCIWLCKGANTSLSARKARLGTISFWLAYTSLFWPSRHSQDRVAACVHARHTFFIQQELYCKVSCPCSSHLAVPARQTHYLKGCKSACKARFFSSFLVQLFLRRELSRLNPGCRLCAPHQPPDNNKKGCLQVCMQGTHFLLFFMKPCWVKLQDWIQVADFVRPISLQTIIRKGVCKSACKASFLYLFHEHDFVILRHSQKDC